MTITKNEGVNVEDKTGQNAASPYGSALIKGVQILNFLASQEGVRSASEIARGLDMNRATVFKLLETLQMIDWVRKDERNATYQLGIGLVRLANRALHHLDITSVCRPYLDKLNTETEETVHLGVLADNMVVYVEKLESPQAVRMYSRIGNASPLYCTGIGKAMMSTWPEEKLQDYLDSVQIHQFTKNTITDKAQLRKELEQVRRQGYAMDNSEHEADVRCIAAPLYKHGILYGAFSVSAPVYRMSDDTVAKYLPMVLSCQKAILERL